MPFVWQYHTQSLFLPSAIFHCFSLSLFPLLFPIDCNQVICFYQPYENGIVYIKFLPAGLEAHCFGCRHLIRGLSPRTCGQFLTLSVTCPLLTTSFPVRASRDRVDVNDCRHLSASRTKYASRRGLSRRHVGIVGRAHHLTAERPTNRRDCRLWSAYSVFKDPLTVELNININ